MSIPSDAERVLADNLADLHSFLLRRIPEPADAADALSDALLIAWRGRHRLPEDDHEARLWLFGVAANVLRNRSRARTRREAMMRRLRADRSVQVTSSRAGDSGEDSDEVSERIRDAIACLPSDLAEIVRLRHWEGFTLEEAATILGIPASTARGRYAAARRRLRQLLAEVARDARDPRPRSLSG